MLFRKSTWKRTRRVMAALAVSCATVPAAAVWGQIDGDFDIDAITGSAPPTAPPTAPEGAGDLNAEPTDPSGQQLDPAIVEQLNTADRLRENGMHPEALREYAKVDPRIARGAIGRALSLAALEEYDSAIGILEQAATYAPRDPSVAETLGKIYLDAQRFEDATETYSALVQGNPVNPEYLFLRGKSQLRYGRQLAAEGDTDATVLIAQALKSFDKAIDYRDVHAESYYERGAAYFALGSIEDALDDFRKAVEQDSSSANYKAQLGFAEYANGQQFASRPEPDKAKVTEHFRNAITALDGFLAAKPVDDPENYRKTLKDLKPDDVPVTQVVLTRARVLLELAKQLPESERASLYEQCIAACERMLEFDENSAEALLQRGMVERYQGDFDKALDTYRQISKIAGESAELMLRRGIIYYHQGELTLAAEDFQRAIDVAPVADGRAPFWLGVVHARQGKLLDAIRLYSDAIEQNPYYMPAFSNRGLTYMKIGEYSRARDDFDRILSYEGENPTIRERRDQAARMVSNE
jgi:tetratricopeptide (TPR) repeat protein